MDATPDKNRSRYVLAVLTAIYMVNTMDRGILAILAEPIRRDLSISDTQFGVLTGLAFALFYTGFGLPAGLLADRVGRVRVIAVACAIWSACSAAGSLATSFATLALSRAGVGVGEAGGTAPSYSLIADHYPPARRGVALGLFHLGSSLATLIGTSVGAWIAQIYGWRLALAVVSLPGILFALLLWATVPEPRRTQSAAARVPIWTSVRDFFSNPLLRTVALSAGLTAFSTYAMMAWLPAFLMRARHMTLGDIALWYGVPNAILLGLGVSSAGWLADRFARRSVRAYAWVPMGATLAMAGAITLTLIMPGWPVALAFGLLAIGLSQMFLAPLLTIVQNNSPAEHRSLYSALFLLVNNLIGAGFGPLYVGMISDRFVAGMGNMSLAAGIAALLPVALVAVFAQWRVSRLLPAGPLT